MEQLLVLGWLEVWPGLLVEGSGCDRFPEGDCILQKWEGALHVAFKPAVKKGSRQDLPERLVFSQGLKSTEYDVSVIFQFANVLVDIYHQPVLNLEAQVFF